MQTILEKIRKTVRWRSRLKPMQERFLAIRDKKLILEAHRSVESAPVDPRVAFPSYKSLDGNIDVERLKALDQYLRDRLEPRVGDTRFWTGPYTLNVMDDRLPGSKLIELQRNISGMPEYFDQDNAALWEPSEHAEHFPEVMDFVRTLPFESIGRVIIMYDFDGNAVTPHRDHDKIDVSHEFIWLRPSFKKPFYLMNKSTGNRQYVEGHTAWFDTVNQFHGADPAQGFSVSLRVDGKFSDELRAKIPTPSQNLASTASLWACVGDQVQH